MYYSLAAVMSLVAQCAPGIAPEAIIPLLHVESGFNDLAINVNKGPKVKARDINEAVNLSSYYISRGYTVDMGLAQINSTNVRRLGLTIEQAFDPCISVAASAKILSQNYNVVSKTASGTHAISQAYSMYNTGSPTKGFRNGYVGKIWKAADKIVPQLGYAPEVDFSQTMMEEYAPQEQVAAAETANNQQEFQPVAPAPVLISAPKKASNWVYGIPPSGAVVFK